MACELDDNVLRIVKWHPSNHGLTCTYSELVASRLGQLIEAPVVRGTVVYVDNMLLPPDLMNRVNQQFHVGFTYSLGQNFSEQDYQKIQNTASLAAAAVQLAWLQVADQDGHNQFLYQMEKILPDKTTRKMNHFVIIDQAMICNSGDWTQVNLDSTNPSYTLPKHLKSRVRIDDVLRVTDQLSQIDEDAIRKCLEAAPEEWHIPREDILKLGDFLVARRNHLHDIMQANFK